MSHHCDDLYTLNDALTAWCNQVGIHPGDEALDEATHSAYKILVEAGFDSLD